ncbi:hypothetical protein [Acidovorax sp. SUPP3334]|uniref:hypothetical protein n=1 Tax=Acidovorax sp. SUPP3334 TaxID=2920881 RepID=UPI0023DE219F|nr:hypothetical protein [Acidovorax sp. SUPP3334]GKT22642.1 hypothetical protein AVHM3334_09070 [Acidovorax sp. SUPP3334]
MGNCIGSSNGNASVRRHQDQGSASTNASAQVEEPASAAFGVDAALSGLRSRERRINGLLGPSTNELLASPVRTQLESLRTQVQSSAGDLMALQQTLNRQNSQRIDLGDDPVGAVRLLTRQSERLGRQVDPIIQEHEAVIEDLQTRAGLTEDHPSMRFPQGR